MTPNNLLKDVTKDIESLKDEKVEKDVTKMKCYCNGKGIFTGRYALDEIIGKVTKAIEVLKDTTNELKEIGFKGNNLDLALRAHNKTEQMITLLKEIHGANEKEPQKQRELISEYKELLEKYQQWMNTIAHMSEGSFGISKAEATFSKKYVGGTTYEASGKYAQQMVNAFALANMNRIQYETYRRQTDQAFDQTQIQSKLIDQLVNDLLEFDAQFMEFNEILDALRQGLQALRDLQGNWKELLTMFEQIKINVQVSMRKGLYTIGKNFDTISDLNRRFLKDVKKTVYQNCYTASIHVFLVQKQADLYYKVSDRILMPALNGLHKLIGISDAEEVNKAHDELKEKTKELPKEIEGMIKLYKSVFNKKFDARLETVADLMGEMENLLPKEVQQQMKREIEETASDLGLTEDRRSEDFNNNIDYTPQEDSWFG